MNKMNTQIYNQASNQDQYNDTYWMNCALDLAKRAEEMGEVPVGAIVIYENEIIGSGYNQSISVKDPTAHAEIIALRQAAQKVNNYRLLNTTLYVTLEPCVMCAGAMVHARIQRLVFGAKDSKMGAAGSVLNLVQEPRLNHRIQYEGGILAEPCAHLLRDFFRSRR